MSAATPVRPLPGAFFNTPAHSRNEPPPPVRRVLFPTPQTTAATRTGHGSDDLQQTGQRDNAPPLPPILKAAKSVNRVLQAEESYPDLDAYSRQRTSSEYEPALSDSAWAPFLKTQTYSIPDQIFEQCNRTQVSVEMGLFAEINHAWASIDSGLFLWDYTAPNPEIIGFEEQNHTIHAVALVPPKPGVFVEAITHILVVATTADIILLGVAAQPAPTGGKKIELYQTRMSVHKGNADVNVIAGTANGRIFVGGISDTDIHEVYYQQEEKWFSSRCGKINHTHPGWSSVFPTVAPFAPRSTSEHLTHMVVDDSRNLLYSLSNKSTIRTYHIEAPDKLTSVITKSKTDCLSDMSNGGIISPLLTDRVDIVSISPISARESPRLHLLALTSTGCRLFLSATNSSAYMTTASANLAPRSMAVHFTKFPPPPQLLEGRRAGADGPGQPVNLTSRVLDPSSFGRRFAPGYFFDFVQTGANPDVHRLFVSGPETGRIKLIGIGANQQSLDLYENCTWIELDQQNKALAVDQTTKPFAATSQPLGFGNELAVQFDHPPSEFVVLTNGGVHVVRRRRMVDIFAAVIRNAVGDDALEREARKFIQLYGRVETVSAALAAACGQGSDFRTGTGRAVDPAVEDRAKTAFITFGGQPTLTETDGNATTAEAVKLSSRHDALALYLTRLVRMLWKAKVISTVVSTTGIVVNSTIPTAKLTIVQENLERLRSFLRANAGSIQGLSGPSDLQRATSRNEEIAVQAEHQALHALQQLMESISEGISFVMMLFDERVADIYTRLDDASRQQLVDLTYEDLFSQAAGKELAKLLVKAIVNRNIESGSNVETVADALRRRCGSFCSPDDVVIFKAQEQLQRATEQIANPNVSRTLLNESLRLFERVAKSLSFANLSSAVEQFIELKYYAGAIQVCLVVAREKDRGNTALAWTNEGRPPNDRREVAWNERKRCYDLVHRVLERLDAHSGSEPEMIDGRLTLAATKRAEAYNVVNDSDDEVFHFSLYEWYIDRGWTDRILSIESPHVITFLQQRAAVDAEHADLLCRFYTHRSRFFEAAKVQFDLANSAFAIGIKDRITLLSKAKGNASVSTTGVSRQQQQQLNHEATELLEIAHIQDDLLERLQADPRIPDERKEVVTRTLNGKVQDLTELFNNYADQAGYFDLSLLIYHAAEYHNPHSIAGTWRHLIESTHQEIEERRMAWDNYRAGRPLADAADVPPAAPPQPYEAVSMQIQSIAHRTSLDSQIFPIDVLFKMLCEYALTEDQDAGIGADPAWPVLLFLQLGVSQAMIVRVLEQILDAQEAPFTGRRRKAVVEWIDAAMEAWVREAERRGAGAGATRGDASLAPWVVELMERAEETITAIAADIANARARAEAEAVVRETRRLRIAVANAVRQSTQGGLRFR